jgi:multidrug efflux pump subunit AcrB
VLTVAENPGRVFRWTQRQFDRLDRGYGWLLDRAFAHRILTVLIGVVALVGGIYAFNQLSREFMPTVDRSEFIISFETSEGSTLQHTNGFARGIERVLDEMPQIKHQFLAIGLSTGGGPGKVSEGISFVKLLDRDERDRHQEAVMQELRERLRQLPGGRAYVIEESIGVQSGAPLQIVLQATEIDALAQQQAEVMQWMRQQPQYIGVNSDLRLNKPRISVSIDRDKASQMGVSVAAISNTMRYLLGEPDISEIERGSERYEIIPEVVNAGSLSPSMLRDLYVRNDVGAMVSLGNLVTLRETIGPSEIHHFDRMRSATISASTPPGVALGDALDKLQNHLDETLPAGFSTDVTGQAREFRESFYWLTIALLFSVVFIYLVLAGQFESFIHPFTILTTLPLASVGAFGMLWALGMTFNIFSFIGLIMLLGMATKNAILLVDYANRMKRDADSIVDAAKRAAHVRFRPVLMTTFSTVLGIMPIAMGFGAGGRARAPLGVAVASGLLATTLLTLIVVPVVYTYFERLQNAIMRATRAEGGTQKGSAPAAAGARQ